VANLWKCLWLVAFLAVMPLGAQEPEEGAAEEAGGDDPAAAQEEAKADEKKEEEKATEGATAEQPAPAAPVAEEESAPAAPAAEAQPAPVAPAAEAQPAPAAPVAEAQPAPIAETTPAGTPGSEEVTAEAEVKEEEKKEEEGKEEEKEAKKYSVGLNNALSQNINKDRPNFGYALTVTGSYTIPGDINLGASIGLAYNLAYLRDRTTSDAGDYQTSSLNHYSFDGTPLGIDISRVFTIPTVEIGVTPAINWSIPFTNRMMWEVYTLRSTLTPSVTIDRAFKLMDDMTLSVAYTCAYSYNFAEEDAVIGKNTNEVFDINVQMSLNNMLTVSWAYKGFSIRVGAGYDSSILYGELKKSADTQSFNQLWNHTVIFNGGVGYSMAGFTDESDRFSFGLGFTTAGPEYENGNYGGFSYNAGGKEGRTGINGFTVPFAGKFTKITATIGYNYSF